jgi:hypothetical protein
MVASRICNESWSKHRIRMKDGIRNQTAGRGHSLRRFQNTGKRKKLALQRIQADPIEVLHDFPDGLYPECSLDHV